MKIDLLGDPHLGRAFIHGVPLHRRGDRERMVWADFENNLATTTADLHVCMGDLFDKRFVSYEVILNAAIAYQKAANRRPNTQFVVLRGNHDINRDLESVSAFDVFTFLMAHNANVHIFAGEYHRIGDYEFYPWNPLKSAAEIAAANAKPCKAAFGHWDTGSFGGDNIVPLAQLKADKVYTGHVHKPGVLGNLIIVGSMQPYAHGEEVNEDLYVTRNYSELGDESYHNKCLRVVLDPGENLEDEIDCLQLTVQKQDEELNATVTIGDFDLGALFVQAFDEANVPEPVRAAIMERHASC